MALGAVRPSTSCRLMPPAAHNRSDSACSGNGSGANSRRDCRPDSAAINGMSPLSEGEHSARTAAVSPTAGKGLNSPMSPSASWVSVVIAARGAKAGVCLHRSAHRDAPPRCRRAGESRRLRLSPAPRASGGARRCASPLDSADLRAFQAQARHQPLLVGDERVRIILQRGRRQVLGDAFVDRDHGRADAELPSL